MLVSKATAAAAAAARDGAKVEATARTRRREAATRVEAQEADGF